MERNRVYLGNNIDILKTFPDNSIDSIVTDPPYGLGKEPEANALLKDWLEFGYHEVKGKGFMGKEWDAFVPQPIFWKECYRVLKHGGYVLSFAGTRTYDWIVMGLRLSGFEIRDQLAWIYGSGFPKSHDVSKAIDKKFGAERKVVGSYSVGGNAAQSTKEKGGTYASNTNSVGVKPIDVNITAPSTDQAKQWQGWGTALKPALEPIVMARKPLDGTVADNVLKHGVGGINIDGCRVGTNDDLSGGGYNTEGTSKKDLNNATSYATKVMDKEFQQPLGRFPANVIHDGSNEVVALFPDVNGDSPNRKPRITKDGNSLFFGKHKEGTIGDGYVDTGSAARFFYTAKASQSERNYGLGGFENQQLYKNTREGSSFDVFVKRDENGKPLNKLRKNIHPTVKPIDLMRYLVRLVTPKGGVCLDPFLGSGTTAVACKAEKFDYIGIELQPEYVKIAEARIQAEMVQMDIFDILED